ncbi:MAG: c-type cytochrome [Pseudohongiellaceae bacterium]
MLPRGSGSAAEVQTTTLDGVYSKTQAQRGARTYQRICAECHEGGEPDADPLFGHEFIDRWREAPLDFLYGFFSRNMPGDEPGSLTTAVYEDVMAYLLQENGYPAGSQELKAGQMGKVLLVGESGPAPLPDSALVRLVGCLQQNGSDWELVAASAPLRVRVADETDDAEVALSAALPPGGNRYALQRADPQQAAALVGKRVQAKGVFNSDSLGLMSLVAVGDGC